VGIDPSYIKLEICCLTTDGSTGQSGFDPRRGQRIFHLTSVSRPALGPTQPPVQWVPGVLSPGGKSRLGRDADHSPHLVPRSRMSRSYTSSPPSAFVACSGTDLAFRNLCSYEEQIALVGLLDTSDHTLESKCLHRNHNRSCSGTALSANDDWHLQKKNTV
jgi:hypothetical protein